jgi:TfoX/Sxy family transcriptional regulator of competence genes
MAYSEFLADRIRNSLTNNHIFFTERKMFGGICFFVDDKMFMGVMKDRLMVRTDPVKQDEYLRDGDAMEMDPEKHSMKGFLYIDPEGIDMDEDLEKWLYRCLEYNPKAKSTRKRRS